MSTKIKFKRSYKKGARPSTTDLDQGELAINGNKDQPALFMEVRNQNASSNTADVVKIGPTSVASEEPSDPSLGETWLTDPTTQETNQRFPTLKVYNGREFVDAVRMVIPEEKPSAKNVNEFELSPSMSGQHLHITKDTDYTNINMPNSTPEGMFIPGQAVSIYNGRSEQDPPLYLIPKLSSIHFAGTDPQLSIGVQRYIIKPGALITLLCVNKDSLDGSSFGTFVLAGAGVG